MSDIVSWIWLAEKKIPYKTKAAALEIIGHPSEIMKAGERALIDCGIESKHVAQLLERDTSYAQRFHNDFGSTVQKCQVFFILKIVNIFEQTGHNQKNRELLSDKNLKRTGEYFHIFIV